jgi:hypothetical protein
MNLLAEAGMKLAANRGDEVAIQETMNDLFPIIAGPRVQCLSILNNFSDAAAHFEVSF